MNINNENKKMTRHIVVDIETLPCANQQQIDFLLASIKPDSRLKDPEKIEADIAAKRADIIDKTGLDGSFGRILCASVGDVDSEDIVSVSSGIADEKAVLLGLIAAIKDIAGAGSHTLIAPKIVGHNIAWDLRFIAQRCVVNNVPFDRNLLPFDSKPWELCDTMTMWVGAGNRISLEKLCVALGVESPKKEMDGSMAAEYFAAGRLEEIVKYNRADVAAARSCYRMMRKIGMAA